VIPGRSSPKLTLFEPEQFETRNPVPSPFRITSYEIQQALEQAQAMRG